MSRRKRPGRGPCLQSARLARRTSSTPPPAGPVFGPVDPGRARLPLRHETSFATAQRHHPRKGRRDFLNHPLTAQQVKQAPTVPVLDMSRRVSKAGPVRAARDIEDSPYRFTRNAGNEEPPTHTPSFPQHVLRPLEMLQHLKADNQVERPLGEREGIPVARDKADGVVRTPRFTEHGRREIKRDHLCVRSPRAQPAADKALSASYLKHSPCPGSPQEVFQLTEIPFHHPTIDRVSAAVLVEYVSNDDVGRHSRLTGRTRSSSAGSSFPRSGACFGRSSRPATRAGKSGRPKRPVARQ